MKLEKADWEKVLAEATQLKKASLINLEMAESAIELAERRIGEANMDKMNFGDSKKK